MGSHVLPTSGVYSVMNTHEPFERVVAAHGARVLRVCRAVLGLVDAEDAWSETFLAALQAYPDLPAEANVEAWLVTIAHRKAIDVTRRRARLPVPVVAAPERAAPDGTWGAAPAADADVWRAVRELPDRQRLCVAYHYLGGLPFAEVAALIGGSADAARRAAHDGIKKLRATYPQTTQDGADR